MCQRYVQCGERRLRDYGEGGYPPAISYRSHVVGHASLRLMSSSSRIYGYWIFVGASHVFTAVPRSPLDRSCRILEQTLLEQATTNAHAQLTDEQGAMVAWPWMEWNHGN